MTDTFHAIRSPGAIDRRKTRSVVDEAPSGFDKFVSVIPYQEHNRRESDFEVKYEQSELQSHFDGDLPDLVLDLVEIAALTFAVDKYVKREIQIEGNDEEDLVNTRNIKLQIPVLSPRLADPDVELLISEIVSHSTRDIFEYEFVKWEPKNPKPVPGSQNGVDAVSLLSDGLDSTGGIFYNKLHGIESHYITLNYGTGIGPTVDEISDRTSIDPSIYGIESLGRSREFTQFSRGFLHLTYGVATALGVGADTVQSFENGIAARFTILSDGWLTTRTVSPHLLRRYNALLDLLVNQSVRITNPFSHKTKTEITNFVPGTDLVKRTVSCPHRGWYNQYPQNNCNLCVPCILRAVALLSSDHRIEPDEIGVFDSFRTADFANLEFPTDGQVLREFNNIRRFLPLNTSANSPEVFLDAMVEIAYFARLILTQERETVLAEYNDLYSPSVFRLHEKFAENFVSALRKIGPINPTVSALNPQL